ncbi:hypothetical protein [Aeromicrobium ginsengisoli]|uniref:Uncharacterized protein n=1 Tax=Aeromicrobium ginsengisoli TaxID=363867 RepID=A0A5M4FEQ9_9ACTN|nr:hypothetical protein [Aeromicrobium ginsengisoli]KAA1397837.1 hypothetical protein ESP70_010870 [Aeromicrobium ginsengisoli]
MSTTIEQLRVAFHLALRAQHTSEFDAAALVRAWPRLAGAAWTVQQSLANSRSHSDLLVERIALDAQSLGAAVEHQPWPGPGRPDTALSQVTAALEHSAKMIQTAPIGPDELPEANRLTASSLWTTSQLVGRAARDHSVDLRMDHRRSQPAQLELASVARDTHRRFNAVEQLAAAALAEPGRRRPVPTDAGTQLRRAIAVWDVEAHRALIGDRSTTVLHVLSHLETESMKAFEGFVAQATETGIIDKVTAGRLSPILRDSSTSWGQLRDASAELSFGSVPVPMTLINAGRDLQERFADAGRHSQPEDHPEVLHALSGHLASAVTISAAARDLIQTGDLRAPARAIARIVREQDLSRLATSVDPVAIQRRQTVPLTPETRPILAAPARRVFLAADEAVNRAAGLDTLLRSPLPVQESEESTGKQSPPKQPPPVMSTPSKAASPRL